MVDIEERAEQLRALMAAATPGPYRAHDHNNMSLVGEDADRWIGYAWVGRITKNSGPNGNFDAGWLDLDRRKDACKEYRERASADAHFVAEALNALPELLEVATTIERYREALEVARGVIEQVPFDFKYPPSADSIQRRIERAERVAALIDELAPPALSHAPEGQPGDGKQEADKRKALQAAGGCYCSTICRAPVVMGQQTACLRNPPLTPGEPLS